MYDLDRYITDGPAEQNCSVICEVQCQSCGAVWETEGYRNFGQIDIEHDGCYNCDDRYSDIDILTAYR